MEIKTHYYVEIAYIIEIAYISLNNLNDCSNWVKIYQNYDP